MGWLKAVAVLVTLAIAVLAYILLIYYFPNEQVLLFGSKPLQRVLIVDLTVKSNKRFPTFLPKNSGFLVVHSDQVSSDHRKDKVETNDIFKLIIKLDKHVIDNHDALYSDLRVLFLKKDLTGLRAQYQSLSALGIKSLFFNPDYLSHYLALYQDKLPHAAGYLTMADGSQRLIHDIVVK